MNLSEEQLNKLAEELAEELNDMRRSLVALRKSKGLTQQDVADELGLTQSAVAQFEHYDANPSLAKVGEYALAIGARINITVSDATTSGQWQHCSSTTGTARPLTIAPIRYESESLSNA